MEILHDKWPGKGRNVGKGTIFSDIFEMVQEDNRVFDSRNELGLDRYGYYG